MRASPWALQRALLVFSSLAFTQETALPRELCQASMSADSTGCLCRQTIRVEAPSPFLAHRNMGSQFFCCFCEADEGPSNTVHPYDAGTCQQNHPRTFDLNANPRRGGQQRWARSNNMVVKACSRGRP